MNLVSRKTYVNKIKWKNFHISLLATNKTKLDTEKFPNAKKCVTNSDGQ
jgi:hypothetical protein